jgi:uncharacterized protein involved in type VI secretion and phage assembly
VNLLEALARTPGPEAERGKIYGAVVGVVSNIDDPDAMGRIKVRFPWLKESDESRWARLVSFMAGPDRGAVFRPEVGDEVLVVFEHGDMRFPYVLGAVWNGKDAMPSERGSDSGNDVRVIKSRSGHTLTFDDSAGGEKVIITDKSGNTLELSSSGLVVKSNAIKIGSAGASESLVLGDAFMQLFNSHTHGTGVGPSSPPVTPMVKGQHVSTKHKGE